MCILHHAGITLDPRNGKARLSSSRSVDLYLPPRLQSARRQQKALSVSYIGPDVVVPAMSLHQARGKVKGGAGSHAGEEGIFSPSPNLQVQTRLLAPQELVDLSSTGTFYVSVFNPETQPVRLRHGTFLGKYKAQPVTLHHGSPPMPETSPLAYMHLRGTQEQVATYEVMTFVPASMLTTAQGVEDFVSTTTTPLSAETPTRDVPVSIPEEPRRGQTAATAERGGAPFNPGGESNHEAFDPRATDDQHPLVWSPPGSEQHLQPPAYVTHDGDKPPVSIPTTAEELREMQLKMANSIDLETSVLSRDEQGVLRLLFREFGDVWATNPHKPPRTPLMEYRIPTTDAQPVLPCCDDQSPFGESLTLPFQG
jgi:hypothetical protein